MSWIKYAQSNAPAPVSCAYCGAYEHISRRHKVASRRRFKRPLERRYLQTPKETEKESERRQSAQYFMNFECLLSIGQR